MYSAKPDNYEAIAKEIITDIGKLLATRPYIAISDPSGAIQYIDAPLEIYAKFIQNFVHSNFNLLNIGDHSLPLSGVNLAFFKISNKAIIVLHIVKGLAGQLLAFKSKMYEWSARIDQLMGGTLIPSPSPPQAPPAPAPPPVAPSPAPKARKVTAVASSTTSSSAEIATTTAKVPSLVKKLTGKEKFPIEDARILQYCDGTNTIEEIGTKTGYARLKVEAVIRDYQKKKMLELKLKVT